MEGGFQLRFRADVFFVKSTHLILAHGDPRVSRVSILDVVWIIPLGISPDEDELVIYLPSRRGVLAVEDCSHDNSLIQVIGAEAVLVSGLGQ